MLFDLITDGFFKVDTIIDIGLDGFLGVVSLCCEFLSVLLFYLLHVILPSEFLFELLLLLALHIQYEFLLLLSIIESFGGLFIISLQLFKPRLHAHHLQLLLLPFQLGIHHRNVSIALRGDACVRTERRVHHIC